LQKSITCVRSSGRGNRFGRGPRTKEEQETALKREVIPFLSGMDRTPQFKFLEGRRRLIGVSYEGWKNLASTWAKKCNPTHSKRKGVRGEIETNWVRRGIVKTVAVLRKRDKKKIHQATGGGGLYREHHRDRRRREKSAELDYLSQKGRRRSIRNCPGHSEKGKIKGTKVPHRQ